MRYIGARASDWRPDRADVKVGYWIAGFIGAAVLYFVAAALVGTLINGNGSPFLS